MNEAFVVIDLETTDREPKDAYICEWAARIVHPPFFGQGGVQVHGGLVRPPVPIPAETSAIHHIIDADVAGAPTWEEAWPELRDIICREGAIVVAHNSSFEREMLMKTDPVVGSLRWLCSYKAACRVWPDAPGHGNECLRYHLGLGTGRGQAQAPHSAGHDARVTHELLDALLAAGTSIEDMLKWTTEPAMLPTCPLGDWRGRKWSEVDEGFLLWILRKITDREDVRFCAKKELERRDQSRAKAVERITASSEEEDDVPF